MALRNEQDQALFLDFSWDFVNNKKTPEYHPTYPLMTKNSALLQSVNRFLPTDSV